MEKTLCPFGSIFREQRKKQGISLWSLAIRIPYRPANIQRIERGLHEPRIGLAIRMLSALDVDAGHVFNELARREGLLLGNARQRPLMDWESVKWELFRKKKLDQARSPFGFFLRETRMLMGRTQKAVAEDAGYTLRNLANVEKGIQDPGVFLALRLALAAYGDPKPFFHHFQEMVESDAFRDGRSELLNDFK